MRKLSYIFLIIMISNSAFTQFHKKHEDNDFKLYGTFDLRNTANQYGFFEVYGIKLGVGNKSLRFGGSYHIYHKNLFSIFTSENFFGPVTIDHFQTKHHTFGIFTEIIAHQTLRWELIFPIQIGIGKLNLDADKAKVTHLHAYDHGLDFMQKEVWVESAVVSIKANYHVVKWAGLTAGLGYNHSFSNEITIRSNFSYLFYSFGAKLFFDEFSNILISKEYRKKYTWEPNFVKKYE